MGIPFDSAIELAALIRSRTVSPVEVAQQAIATVDALDGVYNAMCWRDDETFLATAQAAEKALMRRDELPPFHGVPLPVKDVQAVRGQPNTKASFSMSDAPQPEDDLFIERSRAAGFLLFGRTTTPELASSSGCETPKYGITRNPWDPSLTPGGSSGGSAVAVAAGYAPVATATDGGGSIRMPSSCTGLVGLKPSRGLLAHQAPNWEGSSVDGYLTRSIADIAAVYDAVAAPDPLAWTVSAAPATPSYVAALETAPGPLRIGFMTTAVNGAPVHPEVLAATEAVAALLERLGHEIVPVEPTEVIDNAALELWNTVFSPGCSKVNQIVDRAKLQPYLQRRQEEADALSVQTYLRGTLEMKKRTRTMVAHWYDDFELLLTPTMPGLVPAAGIVTEELNAGTAASPNSATSGMTGFAPFVNVAGLSAISLPTHLDSRGIPIGTQLVGRPFAERTLLALGAILESEYKWTSRKPAMHPGDSRESLRKRN